ncbi:hypothetical protein PI124_g16155 [Phytophthora idaei]|nr:hypothetical protein PI125_g16484 [Phytophthora idaei]KAG3140485.1 hypothetical protein PI126_g15981 [Phytophthora idaei]KAG3238898.1 hypothetical protein PI124_g16155 [Phytophthora idaei]
MSTNPPPAKRSKQSHDPSPIQISFTLPSSQQQRDDGTDNNDRLALEREKRQLDRERVRMEKEKHQMQKEKHNMDKQAHKMEQKIREATLQKLKVETALAKTSAAAAKFDVYKQLIKSGIATDKVESTYHAFEAIEDEEE